MQMELHEKEEDVQHIEHITKRYVPIDDGGAKRQAETIRQRTVFSCYHQGKGCGRMTAKAESPPVNGNEMKVLRRTLWIWPNGASVLGGAFITDERDINGILMIPNRHQDVRNRRSLVPSAGIVLRNRGYSAFSWISRLTACSSLLVCDVWHTVGGVSTSR